MKYPVVLPLLCLLFLPACKPSVEESAQKISRAWRINKYYVENEDRTAIFKSKNKNYSLQFFEDFTFTQSAVVNDTFRTKNGTWAFDEEVDSLFLYSQADTHYYFIRLLRLKNLNIRETLSDSAYDYLMVDY